MDNLWAPWRMEYIAGKREDGCIFCTKPPDRAHRRDNSILHVGRLAFVILNRYPYQSAHIMAIPLRHTDAFEALSAEEGAELFRLLQASGKILREVYRAEGLNIGMNLGQCAGAGIREHLHFHLVPRWVGDTNFFPLLSQTRSMPELLEETYDRLRPAYRALELRGELPSGGHDEPEASP
jgi:ATP adenylyltransferase